MPRKPGDVYGISDGNNIIDLDWMGRVVKNSFTIFDFNDFNQKGRVKYGTFIQIKPGIEINFRASLHPDKWFRIDHFITRANCLVIERLPTSPLSSQSYGLYVNGRYLDSEDLVLQKSYEIQISSEGVDQVQSYIEGNYIWFTPILEHLRYCFEIGRQGKIPSMSFYLSYRYDRYGRAFYEFRSHGLIAKDIKISWLSFEGSNF